MRGLYAFLLTCAAASSGAAQDISLSFPLDCDLGKDCYIQQYVDHDKSKKSHDYHCSGLSYDQHRGTDFALITRDQIKRGVNVLAAAPGIVHRTRNGITDQLYSSANAEKVAGRECGNGVVVRHANGWETQYCHLKKNSLRVRNGDKVSAGTVLAQVGLSGRTQFPHLHLSVRKDGKIIDPFDPDGKVSCAAPSKKTLWNTPLPYQAGGILYAGFSDKIPEFSDIKRGRAARAQLARDANALVVFGYAFGSQKGDNVRLTIQGPNGDLMDETVRLKKPQAFLFRAAGKKLRGRKWPAGTYTGTATLLRNGRIVNSQKTQVVLR